ncbi:MAG: hypothetical protein JSW39_23425 [Desulfobacterales bacterium]|nr:MAG: hypothetical protein JSW39_23425 [Desulfobacterales bacterium]
MYLNRRWLLWGSMWLCACFLTLQAAPASAGPVKVGDTVRWQLTDVRVSDPGQNVNTGVGQLVDNYTVEAVATALTKAPIENGVFRLTYTAFKPKKDTTEQQAELWYVTGKWSITDTKATKKKLKIKHNDAVMRGIISTDLDFNPTLEPAQTIAAGLKWPFSPFGNYWGAGSGLFSGSSDFEGVMELTLERWQKVK